eukprot:m.511455 g.511455  ORF g.511455 m.511455 type:complete len:57 (-) comp102401_c0_seq1:241-411(-)
MLQCDGAKKKKRATKQPVTTKGHSDEGPTNTIDTQHNNPHKTQQLPPQVPHAVQAE